MSYKLLQGGHMGDSNDNTGGIMGLVKGDTRSLDYSSNGSSSDK